MFCFPLLVHYLLLKRAKVPAMVEAQDNGQQVYKRLDHRVTVRGPTARTYGYRIQMNGRRDNSPDYQSNCSLEIRDRRDHRQRCRTTNHVNKRSLGKGGSHRGYSLSFVGSRPSAQEDQRRTSEVHKIPTSKPGLAEYSPHKESRVNFCCHKADHWSCGARMP